MTLDNTKEDEEDGGVLEEISEDDKEEKYDKVDRDDKDDKGDDREDYGDDDEDGVVLATAEKYWPCLSFLFATLDNDNFELFSCWRWKFE